ncbi:methionyl-tRNA formyltransferase [Micropruina sonneratiae]|uniref:methionyl-tRNA formyltransferase n=1 Tax=Micropruina sonneratiae TaxID=2986940 RepID=UPI002225D628|nr:methionyl-tRNA formyltransferase [Micropruina sp. KQZ13P-5]MCW3157712.1 methionyl-tRNA formyltransferase [Micropruina sp. KQZ13P-5]
MRVVFAGTPEVALPALAAIAASDHELVAVVTRPDAPQGRSKRLVPSPVAAWAADHGVVTLKPQRPRDPDFVARLRDLAPEVCPVVAYGALIPADVLAIPKHGWVNVHFSLLPAWRGAAPVQRAILAGDLQTGISVFDLVPALDAGPVYRRDASPLGDTETAGDVLARLAEQGAGVLVEVLDALAAGTATATPQPEDGVTLAPKLTVDDARIDWTASALAIDRQIRACNPNPVAWTTHRGERVKVWLGRARAGTVLAPGVLAVDKRSVHVGTGRGVLELLQVQPAGKKAMAAADWGRGLGAEAGSFE